MYVSLLYALYLCVGSVCLFDKEKTVTVCRTYFIFVVLLILLAGFRPFGVGPDMTNYVFMYDNPGETLVEPSFGWIAAIARYVFHSSQFVFVIYAFLSVSLRGWAIVRNTEFWFLSMLVWMGNFYLLQDLAQIRAAVAVSIFFMGLPYLVRKEKKKYLLCCALAAFFHSSGLFTFFFVFLGNEPLTRNWRILLAAMPVTGYMMYFLHLDPISSCPIPFVQEKLDMYLELQNTMSTSESINVFNLVYMAKLLVFYLLLWKYDVIQQKAPNFPLLIKLFALSFVVFTTLSAIPAFAYRTAEVIGGAVDIILIPYLTYIFKPEWVGKMAVACFATCYLLYNIHVGHLLRLDM